MTVEAQAISILISFHVFLIFLIRFMTVHYPV